MNKRLGLLLIITLTASCGGKSTDKDNFLQRPAKISPSVIYGEDNRQDLFQVRNASILNLADSTVALVQRNLLTAQGSSIYRLSSVLYGTSEGLCSSEPFFTQPTAAFCSGFLVDATTVVTAGHCISGTNDCQATRFLFGFGYSTPTTALDYFPSGEIYSCRQIIHTQQPSQGADFAVIKLDRPVIGHSPLALRGGGTAAVGESLFVIGHPSGLPTKVASDATVRAHKTGYLVANLDTYGGNSGSAVFNAITFEVEGILVRGENDFETQNGCRVSKRCPSSGCRGEDVTLISEVEGYLNPARPSGLLEKR